MCEKRLQLIHLWSDGLRDLLSLSSREAGGCCGDGIVCSLVRKLQLVSRGNSESVLIWAVRACTWPSSVSSVVAAALAVMRARFSITAGAAKTDAASGMRVRMVDFILAVVCYYY